jgi:hypothetical protein
MYTVVKNKAYGANQDIEKVKRAWKAEQRPIFGGWFQDFEAVMESLSPGLTHSQMDDRLFKWLEVTILRTKER